MEQQGRSSEVQFAMKRLAILLAILPLLLVASPVRSASAGRSLAFCNEGDRPLYDAEVAWIGWEGHSAGDAKNTNIIIEDVPWDSFAISLYVPSSSLIGYRAAPGGLYSYHACNRIGFNGTTYRGGAAFMGIQDGISVITDRFVEYLSPSPARLYWLIDGTEYPVVACRNPGQGLFGVLTEPGLTSLGYYVAWCQLFYKGEVTCDLVPVRFTNDEGISEGGMVDKISGRLFRNGGAGTFDVGPDI